ncbi:MAG: FAD-binding protein, partial [Clostridia bacterium]|nr:FAD-binding protein [Clostridia bacterium]
MLKDIYSLLVEYVPQSIVSKDEPMSAHTSFKIGGNADFLVQPGSKEDFVSVMACCKANDIPFTVIGNGSNLLVSDKGIRGVVIKVGKNFSNIYMLDDGIIYAESGASLASVAAFALKNQLTGFEFASGIPGTVGGAMLMNAGAYGGEIKDVAVFGDVLGYDGTFCRIEGENQNFGYRKSGYQDND